VNRVAQNVQVFWLGMPTKTLLGLVIVFFSIGSLSRIFAGLTVDLLEALKRSVNSMASGG
jgi:flagellar biosynthesis protein FliR